MNTLILLLLIQPSAEEKAVTEAANATLVKGSWSFRITPKADLRDGLPQDAVSAGGVAVSGARAADGTFRASDGRNEMFGRAGVFILNAPDGPVRIEEAAEALRREAEIEAGGNDENRRNVTRAKTLYRQYLAIAHLYVYAAAPEQALARPVTDLTKFRKTTTEVIDDKRCTIYAGEMKEAAAKALLAGPFAEIMKGGVSVEGVSGKGRVWINADGLLRRTEFTVGGKFVVATDKDSRRTVPVVLTVTCDITRHGEATVEVPAKVERMLKELTPIK